MQWSELKQRLQSTESTPVVCAEESVVSDPRGVVRPAEWVSRKFHSLMEEPATASPAFRPRPR